MSESELERKRAFECRLSPDRALETLGEAHAFLLDRGLLTLMPSTALPSLFGACHEEPYMPGKRGFALWPKTKYPWASELQERKDVYVLKIHRGKELFLSSETAALAAPLCSLELRRADAGEHGADALAVVTHLKQAGPSLPDELKEELGFDSRRLRAVRGVLERVGAVVARSTTLPTKSGGHRHTSELRRWDDAYSGQERGRGLADLLVAGVRAAVVAPEREACRWFSWTAPPQLVDELVDTNALVRLEPGLLALGPAALSRASDS